MIEIRALGMLAVRDPGAHPPRDLVLAPRQAALLAFLSLSRPRGGVTRDRLLGIFWPEQPEAPARVALRQALYRLRVELGRGVIANPGAASVELIGDFRCDVVTFDAAFEAGRFEDALDLYTGDLMEGFFISGAPEFERWLETERDRLRDRAVEAATRLAQRCEDLGNPAAAANVLRRAMALSPYDERIVRDFARLLFTIGDRGGAIRACEIFGARLSRDLDTEPSPSLRAFAESLRWTDTSATSAPGEEPRAASRPGERAPAARPTSGDPAVSSLDTVSPARGQDDDPVPEIREIGPRTRQPAGAPTERSNGLGRSAATVAATFLLGGVLLWRIGLGPAGGSAGPPLVARRVIVVPLSNDSGDPSLDPFGRLAADWISQSLQRTGLVEVIDAMAATQLSSQARRDDIGKAGEIVAMQIARRTQAGTIVWGSFTRREGELVIGVRIEDARDGSVLRSLDPVRAAVDDPRDAIEELRARVAGGLATVLDARLASIVAPSSPPPTFPAYQSFAEGVDAFLEERLDDAIERFDRAAQLDTTFIMARFWKARTFYEFAPERDSLVLSLLPLRDRLPPAEQAGLDMFVAGARRDWEAMLRSGRRAAKLAPQSMWAQMAAFVALDLGRAQEALADLDVYGPDGGWLSSWQRIWNARMTALHRLGEYEQELAVARRGAPVWRAGRRPAWGPDVFHLHEFYALAALGRVTELAQRVDSLTRDYQARGWRSNTVDTYMWVGQELDGHGFRREANAWFERCLQLSPNPLCMYLAGRYDDADAYYATRSNLRGNPNDDWIAALVAARLGDRPNAERLLARMNSRPWPIIRSHFQQASIRAALGDRDRAVDILRQEPERGLLFEWMHKSPEFQALRDDAFIAALAQPLAPRKTVR